mmetsp:Transcript_15643/g.43257  ORF Transcript_15643/g.43257 Transcript_15643/m.43257 type:complete len:218 (+) Transcript_15643:107-760(+)
MSAWTCSSSTRAMPPVHKRKMPRKTAQMKTNSPPLAPEGKPAATCRTAKSPACNITVSANHNKGWQAGCANRPPNCSMRNSTSSPKAFTPAKSRIKAGESLGPSASWIGPWSPPTHSKDQPQRATVDSTTQSTAQANGQPSMRPTANPAAMRASGPPKKRETSKASSAPHGMNSLPGTILGSLVAVRARLARAKVGKSPGSPNPFQTVEAAATTDRV